MRARGAKPALGAGIGMMAVLGLAFPFHQSLVARYHAWRLERALTSEEARPWLEKLTGDLEAPDAASTIAAMLSPENQNLTFRVFFHLMEPTEGHKVGRELIPPTLGPLLPFIRELDGRTEWNEKLLATWAHFVRWTGPERWRVLPLGLVDSLVLWLDLSETLLEEARLDPRAFEAAIRLFELQVRAEACILGMSPLPRPASFKVPLTRQDVEEYKKGGSLEQVKTWLKERRGTLRFDKALGRCVPALKRDPLTIPVPRDPLPGWKGPLPGRRLEPTSATFYAPITVPRSS